MENANKTIEIRSVISDLKIEQRAADEAARTVTGYAVKFDLWSEPIYGWFKEKVSRKAFEGCDMSDVIMCFNHNVDDILARTTSGTLSLEADDTGLKFSFDMPNTTKGNDVYELVKRGDISHCSFKFRVEEDSWLYADDTNKLDLDERTILKIQKLYDTAIVVYPAYKDTEVSARALEQRKADFIDSQRKNNGTSSRDRFIQLISLKEK